MKRTKLPAWVPSEDNTEMESLNFKDFMLDKGITLQQLARDLGYSLQGVTKAIVRGNLKRKSIHILETKYGSLSKYRQISK